MSTIFTPERRVINKHTRETIRVTEEHIDGIMKWITDRDVAILRLLIDHPFLTIEQIEMMVFTNLKPSSWRNKATERLRRLYHAHCIDRWFPPVGEGAGSTQQHILLDRAGALVLARKLGYQEERSRFKKRLYVPQNYQHTLKIVDFKAMLHLLNKQLGAGEIIRYRMESEARIKYRTQDGKKGEIVPDAFCIYNTGARTKLFFVEIDNATESLEVLQSKIRRYVECAKSNAWRELDWGVIGFFPPVLIVLHEEEKELIRYARSLKSNIRFLFTTYDRFFTRGEKAYENALGKTRRVLQEIQVNMLEPIYKSNKEEGEVAL